MRRPPRIPGGEPVQAGRVVLKAPTTLNMNNPFDLDMNNSSSSAPKTLNMNNSSSSSELPLPLSTIDERREVPVLCVDPLGSPVASLWSWHGIRLTPAPNEHHRALGIVLV